MADGRIGSCHSWDMTISPVNSATTPPQQYPGWGPSNLCTNGTLPFPEPTVCSLCVNGSAFDVHHLPQPTYCCSVSKSCPPVIPSVKTIWEHCSCLCEIFLEAFTLFSSPLLSPTLFLGSLALNHFVGLSFPVLGFP